jgi:hypothetical protein
LRVITALAGSSCIHSVWTMAINLPLRPRDKAEAFIAAAPAPKTAEPEKVVYPPRRYRHRGAPGGGLAVALRLFVLEHFRGARESLVKSYAPAAV